MFKIKYYKGYIYIINCKCKYKIIDRCRIFELQKENDILQKKIQQYKKYYSLEKLNKDLEEQIKTIMLYNTPQQIGEMGL